MLSSRLPQRSVGGGSHRGVLLDHRQLQKRKRGRIHRAFLATSSQMFLFRKRPKLVEMLVHAPNDFHWSSQVGPLAVWDCRIQGLTENSVAYHLPCLNKLSYCQGHGLRSGPVCFQTTSQTGCGTAAHFKMEDIGLEDMRRRSSSALSNSQIGCSGRCASGDFWLQPRA